MISPNDVELLIFDLDGTIFSTTKPVFEAIKKAFAKLDWAVGFSEGDIEKYFGPPSGELYQFITPEGESWQEVRNKVWEEYESPFQEFAQVFPGVKETLEMLREKGYRLALYSNSSTRYFDMAISTLRIRDLFDHVECVQENNLTKAELVCKLKNRFSNMETAVIGDRIHDIEAAKENNALSVGVLYGYGAKEPEQGDVTINMFSELLDIFDRKLPIFEKILEKIHRSKQKDQAFVVGITGIDSAGKTRFADAFEKYLISKNYKTQMISVDDFHNPQRIRYSGENQAENYYSKSFDIQTIVEKLLTPINKKSSFSTRLTLLDLYTDKYTIEKEFSFDQNTIVLFEGVFLFRKELSHFIDYKIFIEISFEESKRRARIRDIHISEEELKKYDDKYLPAQKKYLEEFPPLKIADMIIDNSNLEYPRVKLLR